MRFWIVALCGLLASWAAAHERPSLPVFGVNERYELVVPVVAETPVVDGQLNEPVWGKAAKVGNFYQAAPYLGQPASRATEVLVLSTVDKLFVAFRCAVSSRSAIRAYETRYDGQMRHDERVSVFLDTLHTHDRTYVFTVNARGTKADERDSVSYNQRDRHDTASRAIVVPSRSRRSEGRSGLSYSSFKIASNRSASLSLRGPRKAAANFPAANNFLAICVTSSIVTWSMRWRMSATGMNLPK